EPPSDPEPPRLVGAVGRGDPASAWYAAADRLEAPACLARGRFGGIHGGRAAPSLPAETRRPPGAGFLAGSVPPVLVAPCGCSRTPPRSYGSIDTKEGRISRRSSQAPEKGEMK